jgi:hypothetical protein
MLKGLACGGFLVVCDQHNVGAGFVLCFDNVTGQTNWSLTTIGARICVHEQAAFLPLLLA